MDYCEDENDDEPWLAFLLIDSRQIKEETNNFIVFCIDFCVEDNELKCRGLIGLKSGGRCFDIFTQVSDYLQIPQGKEFGIFVEVGNIKLLKFNPFKSIEEVLSLHAIPLAFVF